MKLLNNATLQSTLDAIHDFSESETTTNEDWERLSETVDYYLDKREVPYYDEDYLPEDEDFYHEDEWPQERY